MQRAEDTERPNHAELRLNSRPVTWRELPVRLRAEFSRRANRVVFVEGNASSDYVDVVRVVDLAREAWYGVPVVLLTPALKKTLGTQCAPVEPRF